MKIAISVPDPVFNAAERLAKELKISRSQLFSDAVSEYVGAKSARAITQKLNEVYAVEDSRLDEVLQEIQLRSADHEAW